MKGDPVQERRHQRENRTRREISTGFFDGEFPYVEHHPLSLRPQPAADRATQTRSVGSEIKREEQDRERLEQRAQRRDSELHRTVGLRVEEVAHGSVRVVERVDHLVGVEIGAEVVVEKRHHVGHVAVAIVGEFACLVGDEGAHDGDEPDGHQSDGSEDEAGRKTARHAAACQAVGARFDRERDEQRNDEQEEEPEETVPQFLHEHGAKEAEPQQEDCARHPARHGGAVLCGICHTFRVLSCCVTVARRAAGTMKACNCRVPP